MIKGVLLVTGSVIIIITNKFTYELFGIALILVGGYIGKTKIKKGIKKVKKTTWN